MKSFVVLCLLVLCQGVIRAEDKKPADKPMQWQGSVDDVSKMKEVKNGYVATEKEFKALCESWKFAPKCPEVDFKKNIVMVATTRGSRLGGKPMLKDGNLTFPAFSTRDLRPGFRYLLVVHTREGVTMVNGEKLGESK